MDRILCVVQEHRRPWASHAGRTTHKIYCTEEHHRRWLALAGEVWEKRCGTVCAIWGLYWHAPSTIRAYASPCRTSSETRGRHTASHVLSDAAHQRIPSGMTSAVSPKLSRSDLVQLPKVGKEAHP